MDVGRLHLYEPGKMSTLWVPSPSSVRQPGSQTQDRGVKVDTLGPGGPSPCHCNLGPGELRLQVLWGDTVLGSTKLLVL